MTSTKSALAVPVLDPSRQAAVVPRAPAVIRAFTSTPADHPVLTLAAGLAAQHRLRAEAHRVVGDPDADDHRVAAAARSVNAADVACAVLIDRIDVWAAKAPAECRAGVVHTESLGQLVDRLAVAFDDLVTELVNGRRRLPSYQTPTGPSLAA